MAFRFSGSVIFALTLLSDTFQAPVSTRGELDTGRGQLIPSTFVPPALTETLVPQLADASVAVIHVRNIHQVLAAQHGHPLAEGRRVGLEGPHRYEGGLQEPVPVRSAWFDRC